MKLEKCMLVDRLPPGEYRGTMPMYGEACEVRLVVGGVPHLLTIDEPADIEHCRVIVAANGEISVVPDREPDGPPIR